MESQLIIRYLPEWNKQGKSEVKSKYKIPFVDEIELKVLNKHLNRFLQDQYSE